MDEIKDTPTDRAAMALLLERFPGTSVDPRTATVGLLNEVWARMARRLASLDDGAFNAIETPITRWRDVAAADLASHRERFPKANHPDREAVLAAAERASDLLGLIVEWRGESFAAAEMAAGRDPYVTEKGWKPPSGWTPPARR